MNNLEYILSLDPYAKTKQFKKGEIIQREGDINASTHYVKKGLLRSYTIDSKGKEHIFMFAPEEWIVADIESQEFNKPVELYIDCLEDSEVIVFDKDCFFKGDLSKEEIHKNTVLLYRRMAVLQRRVLMLMSSPAIDRYEYFLKTYPNLPHRIPQHMIATYLGITPQALSTIRGKIAKPN
ncbi:Crp/Fnr family transcriptional regulator [Aureisphaera galaxeae]|uniref:Crp/Fnr family transcriptional regulator n=1 Tax=Aureisphaera galaxeae TaxID=1538023 RepID=UPI00234FC845|nr:Crp/Fnr family transcriptional regulator [Aureisphaera galaxeae]MDC8003214.1 Crp/Fnr family transcriptional regulator [Aureisphaera galaxeae]